jgi:flagellin-like protein
MKKKAVSPLIATVLLIAFAVALGAFIMNWGKIFTRDQISDAELRSDRELECGLDVGLEIYKINGESQLYYSGGNITFMLKNPGTKNIDSIRIVVIGQNNTDINVTDIPNSSIEAGGVFKGSVEYASDDVDQVEFIPYLNTTGSSTPSLCTGNSLIKEDIPSR